MIRFKNKLHVQYILLCGRDVCYVIPVKLYSVGNVHFLLSFCILVYGVDYILNYCTKTKTKQRVLLFYVYNIWSAQIKIIDSIMKS